jgi:aspartyl protease family protein
MQIPRVPAAILTALSLLIMAPAAVAIDKITVLALFTNKAMVKVDGKQRLLSKGKTSPEGIKLISADAKGAVLEVDGQRKSYALGRQISATFKTAKTSAPIRIFPTSNGMFRVGGAINGFPVDFLVDTGATLIAMNRNEARRLGLNYRINGQESKASTASGIVPTFNLKLRKVSVGTITLTNVEASVIEGDFPTKILLGNSFLNRVDMRREGRAMELRKRAY